MMRIIHNVEKENIPTLANKTYHAPLVKPLKGSNRVPVCLVMQRQEAGEADPTAATEPAAQAVQEASPLRLYVSRGHCLH